MKVARRAVAIGLAGALVTGGVPAFALADDVQTGAADATAAVATGTVTGTGAESGSETGAGTGTGTSDTPSVEPEPIPEPEPEPEPTPSKKDKKKKKKAAKKAKAQKPATRATLAKNLGKTSKTSRAFVTTGTKYKVKKTKAGKKLVKIVNNLRRRHRVEFAMIDIKTGATLASQSGKSIYSASCLKGPYVAAINKYKRAGTGSGTRYLERETIVYSNNDTYKSLHNRYGTGVMHKYAKYAKVSSSYPWWSRYAYVKPSDLAKLWVANYWYFFKDTNSRSKYIRNLYTHGTQSFIYQTFRGKKRVYAKPGWYPGAFGNVHNDAGIVTCKVKVKGKQKSYPYVVCVMSGAYGSEGSLRSIVRQLDKVHTEMVKASL